MTRTLFELGLYNTETHDFVNISDQSEEKIRGHRADVIETLRARGWRDIAVTEFAPDSFKYWVHFVREVKEGGE